MVSVSPAQRRSQTRQNHQLIYLPVLRTENSARLAFSKSVQSLGSTEGKDSKTGAVFPIPVSYGYRSHICTRTALEYLAQEDRKGFKGPFLRHCFSKKMFSV